MNPMSRFPLQTEAAECGLACLATCSQVLGAPLAMAELRRRHPASARGQTLKEMAAIAQALGMVARGVRCEIDELAQLRTPAILHWQLNHFVVLLGVRSRRVQIFDPAAGVRRLPLSEVSAQFTGVALELTRAPSFRKRKLPSPLKLSSLLQLTPELRSGLGQVLGLSLIIQLFVLATPFYLQIAIDEAALKGDIGLLGLLAIGFGVMALFNVVAEASRGLVLARVASIVSWDLTTRLHHHLIRLPLAWFQRRRLADAFTRFESLEPIRALVAQGVISAVIDLLMIVGTCIMMVIYAPMLLLVVLTGAVAIIAVRLLAVPLTLRLGSDALVAMIAEQGKRIETLRAIQTLKVMSAEADREGDWANRYADVIRTSQSAASAAAGVRAATTLIDSLGYVALIYLGVKGVLVGDFSIGLLYAFLSYRGQFSARLSTLLDQVINWRLLDLHSERVADIAMSPLEPGIDDHAAGLPDIEGGIQLENVSFAYTPQDAPTLRHVNLEVKAGEFIAITGPSGAGKSTLLKVMAGLYAPSGGQIALDGMPFESWGPRAVRRSLGVVMQDDELLSGSIAENVAFFAEDIDIDRVWEAMRLAAVADEVQAMPMRAESMVGDMGSALSGGQKQRILMARALYRQPRILLLDEATSHLDTARERQISDAIANLKVTRIVVAHRPETIAAADQVYILQEGRLFRAPQLVDRASA